MNFRLSVSLIALLTLSATSSSLWAQEKKALIDDDIINDPHFREEKGLNSLTAPSIDKIFDQLEKLSPLPIKQVPSQLQKRMPIKRADLAIEIGFLISEGFLAVQSGEMKKIEPLAAKLSKYANALGAGEKIKGHASSILKHAENNDVKKLKQELSATQRDVEKELIQLQDIDLSHLISLGGWIRALEISSFAVNEKFTEERAMLVYREDIADYYAYILESVKPSLKSRDNFKKLKINIAEMQKDMLLKEGEKPTKEGVAKINKRAKLLVTLSLTREK